MSKLKRVSLVFLIIGYLVAGANHFHAPGSYIKIIPHYIPFPVAVNLLSGFLELLFAIMLVFKSTRKLAAWGIILLLLAFLPVHIQMVTDAPFMLGTLKVSPLIAWIRLVVLQPLLIIWAWWYTRGDNKI